MAFLLNKGLFDAPSATTSGALLQPPMCKSKQLRKTTFNLILELCRSCDENVRDVARLCSPRHIMNDPDIVMSRSSTTMSTSGTSSAVYGAGSKVSTYTNYNAKKSLTGFVGLRNLCCTCYMNATNQNLFMVEEWRRAILAIDIDTGDQKESMIHQTQRMYAYLQESEKQYYDPAGFCHTYKDPDDPSKPINPRIQQDASAYYGRLLHSIKDLVVNTRHENILDVFNIYKLGEKFATGSDGHKYKSTRDEPSEQYLSVDVRGVKTLNQSLAKQFAGNDVDFKWDKHDNKHEKEELSTRKRSTIKKLPPCLPIHLKRFDLDYTTFQTVKLNERFDFPVEINMFPYTLEGRKYYDARGGSPIVVAGGASGDSSGASGSSGAETSGGAGGESKFGGAGGSAGGKDNTEDQPKTKKLLRQNSSEEEASLMFVPDDAPHPKEYYQYDLCGITIHAGTANGGHYFSYIRERDDDVVIYEGGKDGDDDDDDDDETLVGKKDRGAGEGKEGDAASLTKMNNGRKPKWCEFNDKMVSMWDIDRLEDDCFGGEGTRQTKNYKTGVVTTTKFEKRQNAFMLFYERKKTKVIVANDDGERIISATSATSATSGIDSGSPDGTDSSSSSSSSTGNSKGEESKDGESKIGQSDTDGETKENATTMVDQVAHVMKVREAATKMMDSVKKNQENSACTMPPDLYEEIWGQNMVAWKKRNLTDPHYSEFMQKLVGLTVSEPLCQQAQLEFGTKYMLATLVHLPKVEDVVLRDWKIKIGKGFQTNPKAAEWFLNLILNPDDDTLYDSLTKLKKYPNKISSATRLLVGEAMAAVADKDREIIACTFATEETVQQLLNAAADEKSKESTKEETKEERTEGSKEEETILSSVPTSLSLIVKFMSLTQSDPSRAWPFEMLNDFVQRGSAETAFILNAGMLQRLCRVRYFFFPFPFCFFFRELYSHIFFIFFLFLFINYYDITGASLGDKNVERE